MPTRLTVEQILALAPDAAVARDARSLATPKPWQNAGQSASAAWGEYKGSGKEPYRVQIDLREPTFRCSCPSRKFPCKHGLGLLLLLVAQPAVLPSSEPPAWVAEWLARREQSAQKKASPPETETPTTARKRPVASARSAAAREASVAGGIAELERWIADLLRQGLANLPARGPQPWQALAARMVDAQAAGLARMLRELATLPNSGEGWQARVLSGLAELHVLLEGYRRLTQLSPELQTEIRTRLGWNQDQDAVRAGPLVTDQWLVLGQRVSEEDRLRVLRVWLQGQSSSRQALLLSFAAPGQQLERVVIPGTRIHGDLAFFAGAFPQRALLVERHAAAEPLGQLPGYASISAAIGEYASALAANPWLELFPFALCSMTPIYQSGRWLLCDGEARVLRLNLSDAQGWRLLALSAGHALDLFGEWDGERLTPLSVWSNGALLPVDG